MIIYYLCLHSLLVKITSWIVIKIVTTSAMMIA